MNPQIIEIALKPSEFSFALSLISARSIVGVEPSRLFPTEQAARDKMQDEGFRTLQENGWMVQDEQKKHTINPILMLMVTAVADPQIVISTVRYLYHQPHNHVNGMTADIVQPEKQIATHYIVDDITIEQIYGADERYHLVSLPIWGNAIERIVNANKLADSAPQDVQKISVPSDSIANYITTHGLQIDSFAESMMDLSTEQSLAIKNLLQTGVLCSEITISRIRDGKVLSSGSISILDTAEHSWMIHDAGGTTIFEYAEANKLEKVLTEIIKHQ